jgi:hypothetical protein
VTFVRATQLVVLSIAAGGCGGSVSAPTPPGSKQDAGPDAGMPIDAGLDAEAGIGTDSAVDTVDAASGCSATSTSSLPGVTLAFRSPLRCTFTVAQARATLAIPYDVIVANDVSGVVPIPQDAGYCGSPGPSQLIVLERLAGGTQSYCLCDVGLCQPIPSQPVTLKAGTFTSSFSWGGNNWAGPSDTNNPMGAPFPPGSYTLTVSATGTWNGARFLVTATLPITLTP